MKQEAIACNSMEEAKEVPKGMNCCGSKGTRHKKGCAEDAQASSEAVADISAELSGEQKTKAEESEEKVAVEKEVPPLDLSSYPTEQLEAFRTAINNQLGLEDEALDVEDKPHTLELRQLDDKTIVSFGRAYRKKIFDVDEQRDVVVTHIDVKFLDEEEEQTVLYRDFNNAHRIACEITDTKRTEVPKILGKVFSKEKGRLVPNKIVYLKRVFTIKLPSGKILDIDSVYVN